jgi:hypothetical protein
MNAIITLEVHSKIHNHCIGRLKLKIIDKMQTLNLDLYLIVTNEYGKKKEYPCLNYKILFIMPQN